MFKPYDNFRESSVGSVSDTQSSSRSITPPTKSKFLDDLFAGDEEFLSASRPLKPKEEATKPDLSSFDKLFLSKEANKTASQKEEVKEEKHSDEIVFVSKKPPVKASPKKLTPSRKSLSQKRKSTPTARQAKISSFFTKK